MYNYFKLLVLFFVLVWVSPVSAGSVILGWNSNAETDLAGYKIYYGTSSRDVGGYAQPNFHDTIPAGTETYTFPDLADGPYYFSLTAYDSADNESEFSDEVFAELTADETHTILLGWLPNIETDLAGYKVYYGTASRDEGGYAQPIFHDIIPAGTETYYMENVSDGIYYFSLSAFDLAGNESDFSNEIWTVVPEFEPPYSDEGLTVLDITNN